MQRFSLKKMAQQRGVKRQIALRPIRPRLNIERELYKIIMGVIVPPFRDYRALIIREAKADRPVMTTDGFLDILRAFRAAFGRLAETATHMVERTLGLAAAKHTEDWQRAVNETIGIDLGAVVAADDVAPHVRLAAQAIAALITGLTEEISKRIATKLVPLITHGAPVADMEAVLVSEFGFAKKRAKLIARDQASKFNGSLNRIRQQQAGITEYKWLTRHDIRVRGDPDGKYPNAKPSHYDREDKVFSWAKPPSDGHPGEPINCLPGETTVRTQSNIKRIFRRRHDGETTLLVTNANEALETTPNHPILTRTGWKPAQFINVGDDLVQVRFGSLDFLKMEVEQRQPRMADMFDLFAAADGEEIRRGLGRDFHGDAVVDAEINVVSVDSALRGDVKSSLDQRRAKIILKKSLMGFSCFAGLGSLDQALQGPMHSTHSIVRLAGEMQSFLLAQALHPQPIGMGAISDWHAGALEVIGNSFSLASEVLSKRKDAFAGLIHPNHLVAIELLGIVRDAVAGLRVEAQPSAERLGERTSIEPDDLSCIGYAGPIFDVSFRRVERVVGKSASHVFNLETGNGWYMGADYAVHNCRCVAVAVLN